jgi:hypothetical protein
VTTVSVVPAAAVTTVSVAPAAIEATVLVAPAAIEATVLVATDEPGVAVTVFLSLVVAEVRFALLSVVWIQLDEPVAVEDAL